MTTTVLQVAQEIANLTDILQFFTADSVSATGIANVRLFGNDQMGVDERAGYYIWRYGLTGNDRVKLASYITNLTTGFLSIQSGTAYSDVSTLPAALSGLDPDIILAQITKGHDQYTSRTMQPLITFTDADMRRSDANYWDGTSGGSANSNCTPTKITTDAFEGGRALQLVFSAAGYNRGPKRKVYPGQTIWTAFRGKTSASTLTFNLWNATGAALITTDTAPTYAGIDYGIAWRRSTVPAGCNEVQVQINAAAACTAVVDAFWGPYIFGDTRITLPVDLDDQWRLRLIRPTRYNPLPGTSQVYDAYSRIFTGDLMPPNPEGSDPGDFSFEINELDVNPYAINLNMPIEQLLTNNTPIDLATERYLSEGETSFAVPTDVSVFRRDKLVDFAMLNLCKQMTRFYAKGDEGWTAMQREYAARTAFQVAGRWSAPSRQPQNTHTRLVLNA